jgi:hypothetical protein
MYYTLPGYGSNESGDPFTPSLFSNAKTTREQRIYVYYQRRKGKKCRELGTEVGLSHQGVINVCKRVNRKIRHLKTIMNREHKTAKKLNLSIWEYRKIYTQ